ncbi:MAG: hypothetical protein M0020_06385 [Actinomycetota bacterium]|nr:hypothetical protein [Actinomycetota bacterium]
MGVPPQQGRWASRRNKGDGTHGDGRGVLSGDRHLEACRKGHAREQTCERVARARLVVFDDAGLFVEDVLAAVVDKLVCDQDDAIARAVVADGEACHRPHGFDGFQRLDPIGDRAGAAEAAEELSERDAKGCNLLLLDLDAHDVTPLFAGLEEEQTVPDLANRADGEQGGVVEGVRGGWARVAHDRVFMTGSGRRGWPCC